MSIYTIRLSSVTKLKMLERADFKDGKRKMTALKKLLIFKMYIPALSSDISMLIEFVDASFSKILCPDKLYNIQVICVTDGDVM